MYQSIRRTVRQLVVDEAGLETVEYAIITGLVVAGTILVIASIGAWVLSTFQTVQSTLGA